MKHIGVITSILLLLGGGITWLIIQTQNKQSQPEPDQLIEDFNEQIPRLIIGDDTAAITIIEYGDFQCPICKRWFEITSPKLREEYINSKKAKIEFRVETHIGEESVLAGQAAFCANDQGKFTQYHDELFRRQGPADTGIFKPDNLKLIAQNLGLNPQEFSKCLDGEKYLAAVKSSDAAAKKVISATPTFFIGTQKIVGAQPFSIFEAVLKAMGI